MHPVNTVEVWMGPIMTSNTIITALKDMLYLYSYIRFQEIENVKVTFDVKSILTIYGSEYPLLASALRFVICSILRPNFSKLISFDSIGQALKMKEVF